MGTMTNAKDTENISTPLAIYIRLSASDGYTSRESESVSNQRTFLQQWAKKSNFEIVQEFVDDGHSGTDFDRAGFKALMEWLKSGKVKTFATTDLSRLGRNYLEVGLLQEQTFPALGIRYIAVTDGYDSAERNTFSSFDPVIFKNILNDSYSRDISNKVVRAKRTLQREGKFIGNIPPYGYRVDTGNKHHLVPDAETAPVVIRIYRDFLSGKTTTGIARSLTLEKIPTPAQNKNFKGRNFTGIWNGNTIKRILSMPTYCGAITQHSTEMVSYKIHVSRRLRPEEWIVVQGTHEPLIAKEDFEEAQRILEQRPYTGVRKREHLLSGITFCADCGAKMYPHKINGHFYMTCYNYNRNPGLHLCTAHYIREDTLEEAVCESLRSMAKNAADTASLAKARKEKEKKKNLSRSRAAVLQTKMEKSKAARLAAYKDKADGVIPIEEYLEIAEKLREEEQALHQQLEAIRMEETHELTEQKLQEKIAQLLLFKSINKTQLQQLVRRIEIGADKTITIEYTFQDPAASG